MPNMLNQRSVRAFPKHSTSAQLEAGAVTAQVLDTFLQHCAGLATGGPASTSTMLSKDIWERVYAVLEYPLDRKRLSLTCKALQHLSPSQIAYTECYTSHTPDILIVLEEAKRGIHHVVLDITASGSCFSSSSSRLWAEEVRVWFGPWRDHQLQEDYSDALQWVPKTVMQLSMYSSREHGFWVPKLSLQGIATLHSLSVLDVIAHIPYLEEWSTHQLLVSGLSGFADLQMLTSLTLFTVNLSEQLCLPPRLQTLSMRLCTSAFDVLGQSSTQLTTVELELEHVGYSYQFLCKGSLCLSLAAIIKKIVSGRTCLLYNF